jgi:molybdopterin molybdotransferase
MAFLHLALPGLMRLAGYRQPSLPQVTARLQQEVGGQVDWTQFIMGRLEREGEGLIFHPQQVSQHSKTSRRLQNSRLMAMAEANGVLAIPEGTSHIPAGRLVPVTQLAVPA